MSYNEKVIETVFNQFHSNCISGNYIICPFIVKIKRILSRKNGRSMIAIFRITVS